MSGDIFARSYEHNIGALSELAPPDRSLADDERWVVRHISVSPHPMWDSHEIVTVVWEREIVTRGPF